MTETELVHCNLDLWLMGHTHIPYPNKPDIRDEVFYPATPEPDGFDCSHEGKALILDIDDKKKIVANFISTGQYSFIHDSLKVKSWRDIEKIQKGYSTEEHKKSLLKLKLSGRLPEEDYRKLPDVRDALKKHLAYLQFDNTELTVKITKDVIDKEFPEGSFSHRLLSSFIKDDDLEALQFAYDLIIGARK